MRSARDRPQGELLLIFLRIVLSLNILTQSRVFAVLHKSLYIQQVFGHNNRARRIHPYPVGLDPLD